jgi:HAD superfamily hydrolase (TIGR01484 family)
MEMKPIGEMTADDIKDIKIVVFDVDGVTIKKGTDIKEVEGEERTTLTVTTSNLPDEILQKLIELKKRFIIAIASGRSLLYLTKIYYNILWENAALIAENGIFILKEGFVYQKEKFDERTLSIMRNIFVDLKALGKRNKDFRAFEPKQFLITVHAWKEIPEVYEIVKKHDVNQEFYCLWNGEAFDIAPKRLNKGQGIKNLAESYGYSLDNVMSLGNGPNDKEMVEMAKIGITTDKSDLSEGKFYTTDSLDLGGIQAIDKLLELIK